MLTDRSKDHGQAGSAGSAVQAGMAGRQAWQTGMAGGQAWQAAGQAQSEVLPNPRRIVPRGVSLIVDLDAGGHPEAS